MKLLHSKKITADYEEFLEDLKTSVDTFLGSAKSDSNLKSIFKTATAAHASLRSFSKNEDLLLIASAGIVRRCATLAMIRQMSLARVELRRLIECIFWYVYFIDHPVEWEEFLQNPSRGYEDRSDTPIAAAASAPIGTFARYAKERLRKDPSGFGIRAANELQVHYSNLSAEVHAALGATHSSGSLALAFDKYDPSVSAKLAEEMRQVFTAATLICAVTKPSLVASLDAIDRAWFDWLITDETAKQLRGTPFGISSR